MSSWLAGIIGMYIGSALGILAISIVSVGRQTEWENDIYREGFAEGHRIGLRKGKVLKIDAALYEELEARAGGRVGVAPGPDSIREWCTPALIGRPEKWAENETKEAAHD